MTLLFSCNLVDSHITEVVFFYALQHLHTAFFINARVLSSELLLSFKVLYINNYRVSCNNTDSNRLHLVSDCESFVISYIYHTVPLFKLKWDAAERIMFCSFSAQLWAGILIQENPIIQLHCDEMAHIIIFFKTLNECMSKMLQYNHNLKPIMLPYILHHRELNSGQLKQWKTLPN